MKKVFIVLLMLIFMTSFVFAAEPVGSQGKADVTGAIDADTPKTDTTAYVKVNLSFGTSTDPEDPDSSGEKVVVGFTNAEVTDSPKNVVEEITAITADDFINLELDPDSGTASLNSSLYAFWQVQSGRALKVDLYTSGPLTGPEGGSLAWTVHEGSAEGNVLTSSSETAVTGDPIYQHQTADKLMGHAGSKQLYIKTANYTNQPVGDYSGYLYIEVANPE